MMSMSKKLDTLVDSSYGDENKENEQVIEPYLTDLQALNKAEPTEKELSEAKRERALRKLLSNLSKDREIVLEDSFVTDESW